MNLPAYFFSESTLWLTGMLTLLLLLYAIRRVAWTQLDAATLNIWMGSCVAIMLLWTLSGNAKPGIDFHILGVSVLLLLAGPWAALIGMALVLATACMFDQAEWVSFGPNFLLLVLAPLLLSQLLFSILSRLLLDLPRLRVLGAASLAAGISYLTISLGLLIFFAMSGIYTWNELMSDAWPYALWLSLIEAILTGGCVGALLLYTPCWVVNVALDSVPLEEEATTDHSQNKIGSP